VRGVKNMLIAGPLPKSKIRVQSLAPVQFTHVAKVLLVSDLIHRAMGSCT